METHVLCELGCRILLGLYVLETVWWRDGQVGQLIFYIPRAWPFLDTPESYIISSPSEIFAWREKTAETFEVSAHRQRLLIIFHYWDNLVGLPTYIQAKCWQKREPTSRLNDSIFHCVTCPGWPCYIAADTKGATSFYNFAFRIASIDAILTLHAACMWMCRVRGLEKFTSHVGVILLRQYYISTTKLHEHSP